jgi:Leucine-rich repeat (LRR) protein
VRNNIWRVCSLLDILLVCANRLFPFWSTEEIRLDNNQLVGNIPSGLSTNSGLRRLSLGENAFVGPLPPDLFRIFALENISIEGNYLSGTVSEAIENLQNLKKINLGKNSFTGSFPSTAVSTLSSIGK